MPFYLRKSFRMGPLRLNLSKSGLGMSAGVTGARIGVNARGQSYVHGGRYGLYYRKNLGSVGGGRSGSTPYPQRQDHFVDTGVTFRSAAEVDQAEASGFEWPQLPSLVDASNWWNPLRILRRRSARKEFARLLRDSAAAAAAVSTEGLAVRTRVAQLAAGGLPVEDVRAIGLSLYRELAVEAVADHVLTGEELQTLQWVASTATIDAPWREHADAEALRTAFLAMAADREFTAEEEGRFDALRAALKVADAELTAELETADRLRILREIRTGELPVVETKHKLQRGEVCHLEAPARVLGSKILHRQRRAGVAHVIHGLTLRHEGTLLVTSKRVMVRHTGTTSIAHSKITHLELDLDRDLLMVSKDGVSRPTYISTPDAERAAALIARLAGV